MRRPEGYLIITDPEGPAREYDTFTCSHCQRVVRVPAQASTDEMSKISDFCRVCMHLTCAPCGARGCVTWERQMEIIEARARFHRALERM